MSEKPIVSRNELTLPLSSLLRGHFCVQDANNTTEPTFDELIETIESLLPVAKQAEPITNSINEVINQLDRPNTLMTVLVEILAGLCQTDTTPETLGSIMERPLLLSEQSVFYNFVFQFRHSLSQSSFTTLIRLCKQTQQYKIRHGTSAKRLLGAGNKVDLSSGGGFRGLRSASESMQYLQRVAEEIEALVGQEPRHVITARIEQLEARSPRTPQTHFLLYLVCLHHGDYVGALDKLHQYFDHVLAQRSPSEPSLLPYATLNLAAVHLRFGHIDEALEVVREVTANVQRRSDDVCLARTLALLYSLAEHRCDQTYQLQLLQQTLSRALKLCLGSLSATVMLDTAKHYLLYPRENALAGLVDYYGDAAPSARPDAVWRLIQASLSAATRADTSALSTHLTSQALLKATESWNIYGNSSMATLSAQLQLDIHRTAHSSPHLSSSAPISNVDAAKSLCTLAKLANEIGEEKEALRLLLEAHNSYPQSTYQSHWTLASRQILQDCALRRGDLDTAEIQAIQLSALSPLNLHLEQHIDALYRLTVVLMHKGAWVKASTLIHSLIDTCQACGLTILSAGLRMTLAEIHLRAGAPTAAVGPLLEALTLAEQFGLDQVRVTAIVQLAHIRLKENTGLGAKTALSLLDEVMPHILQHGPALLQAQAKMESAKAVLCIHSNEEEGMASEDVAPASIAHQHEVWTDALAEIEDAIQLASKLHCKQVLIEAWYFKARLLNATGRLVQRNLAAKTFRSLLIPSHAEDDPVNTTPLYSPTGSMHYYIQASTIRDVMTRLASLPLPQQS